MEVIYIIAGFIIIVLIFVLTPKKPLVANVSSAEEILEIAQTNKIQAIKEFKAFYGVGLKDAKDAVEKMLRENAVTFDTPSKSSNEEEELIKIKNLISEGHTIEAIKEYRALYGVGLREAKEAVESMS